MNEIAEPYIRRRAVRHLEKGRVVVFVAGTGNPYFTTDTAATLRAVEIGAEVILKATRVDGVYDADPEKHPDATRFAQIGYTELLASRLEALDATAVSLAMDNEMPIVVFDMTQPGNILRARARRDDRDPHRRVRCRHDARGDPGGIEPKMQRSVEAHGARLRGHPHRPRLDRARRADHRSSTTARRRRSTRSPASARRTRT